MIREYLDSVWQGLNSFAFDNSCIICRKSESQFCISCRREWRSNPKLVKGEEFPIYASIPYSDTAATIVLLAKENGVKFTKTLLLEELTTSILEFLKKERVIDTQISLVPIPSSRKARTRRGIDFIAQLTNELVKELNQKSYGTKFSSRSILKLQKRVVDQSGLSESKRHENLSGAFRVSADFSIDSGIIIIDDVVTTGSTLREAVRALKERNLTVLGAVTACASQRRLLIR